MQATFPSTIINGAWINSQEPTADVFCLLLDPGGPKEPHPVSFSISLYSHGRNKPSEVVYIIYGYQTIGN